MGSSRCVYGEGVARKFSTEAVMQCKTCCNVIPCRSPYSLNVEAKNGTSASDIAMTRHATNLIELLETGQDNGWGHRKDSRGVCGEHGVQTAAHRNYK